MLQDQSVSTQISSDARIQRHAKQLSKQLQLLRERLFPPSATKQLRTFTSGEAAQLVGVSDGFYGLSRMMAKVLNQNRLLLDGDLTRWRR